MSTVAYLFHPNHGRGLRQFLVTVQRADGTERREAWAPTSMDAFMDALEAEATPPYRIDVKPMEACRAHAA